MTIDEAVMEFGTAYRLCKELNVAPQNMTRWKRYGYIPLLQQYRIAELTDGRLMPDEIDPKTLIKPRKLTDEMLSKSTVVKSTRSRSKLV